MIFAGLPEFVHRDNVAAYCIGLAASGPEGAIGGNGYLVLWRGKYEQALACFFGRRGGHPRWVFRMVRCVAVDLAAAAAALARAQHASRDVGRRRLAIC